MPPLEPSSKPLRFLLLLFCLVLAWPCCLAFASAQPSDPSSTVTEAPASPTTTTCAARTINYITHTLPQSCLTSAWSGATPSASALAYSDSNNATDATEADASPSKTGQETASAAPASTDDDAAKAARDQNGTVNGEDDEDAAGDAATKPFMSFEDWKEMMLRQTGQDPQDLRSRQVNHRADDRVPPDMGHNGLGEEDEISLNFDSNYPENNGGAGQGSGSPSSDVDRSNAGDPNAGPRGDVAQDGNWPSAHRGKDAGKTCKERFSYSSFDAGATVLKSSSGSKNAKAILVENKDSYMLLECSAKAKFIIVELSDDILIDTIVLANFEFFSSMIRHFRLSVSDRYPVKLDRWHDLGTYEARNSRDIQPFLVENPQIWARYVRIEFLTQYGNEFYCPVSLIRVHGTRMMDSWKDTEPPRDHEDDHPEDELESLDGTVGPGRIDTGPTTVESVEESSPSETGNTPAPEEPCSPTLSPVDAVLFQLLPAPTCAVAGNETDQDRPSPADGTAKSKDGVASPGNQEDTQAKPASPASRGVTTTSSEEPSAASTSQQSVTPANASAASPPSATSSAPSNDASANSTSQVTGVQTEAPSNATATTATASAKSPPPNPSAPRNRTTGTNTAPAASPTVQEGFFKHITKRLHAVEANLTLSLQYVEDQARHLQESLQKTEQKQINKATLFLNNLNQTVLAELRNVRDQYDQIWQSTVIALESQREQSEREIVALSTRLNLLADEAVFQKRMAIVQAVLILSCLLLVIFSRNVSFPSLGPFNDQSHANAYEGPWSSPGRIRKLYGASFNLARSTQGSPVPTHPDAGYASMVSGDDELRHGSSFLGEQQTSMSEYEQLSPPPTPGLSRHSSEEPEESIAAMGSQSLAARRSASMHQANQRKPLPALPENPSSP